ncbi:MAG TPA: hypothetical protein VK636_06820, partial [Gemmatimonadaceae bacterium]|nr:hypothetical protein [Gemmatimonadaceae bacterium]
MHAGNVQATNPTLKPATIRIAKTATAAVVWRRKLAKLRLLLHQPQRLREPNRLRNPGGAAS